MNALDKWLALYVQDVRENPEAYKGRMMIENDAYARMIVDGLTDSEIRRMTRELRAERKAIAKGRI